MVDKPRIGVSIITIIFRSLIAYKLVNILKDRVYTFSINLNSRKLQIIDFISSFNIKITDRFFFRQIIKPSERTGYLRWTHFLAIFQNAIWRHEKSKDQSMTTSITDYYKYRRTKKQNQKNYEICVLRKNQFILNVYPHYFFYRFRL